MPVDGPQVGGSEARLLGDERFLRRVAYLYYEEGNSQEVIAEREYCSRQTVSKALQKAKERGIVRISIVPDLRAGFLRNLARDVRIELGLEDLVLVPGRSFDHLKECQSSFDEVVIEITTAAADYLDQLLKDGDKLAICGGKTFMRNVERYLKPTKLLPNLDVVATIGFVQAHTTYGDANLIAHDIAVAYGGRHTWFCAGAFFPNATPDFNLDGFKALIRQYPMLDDAYSLYEEVSIFMLSVWPPHTNDDVVTHGIISPEQMQAMDNLHPVADINHWVFDAKGRCINELMDSPPYYLTGFEIPRLKEVLQGSGKKSILVAGGGPDYIPAIRAALRAGVANILITDHVTAQLLLEI
ncbi:hypothetical protein KSC_065970 [Ktedonobacter sp. SOSP1-52]|uniref:sugar-binding transcriptional regulator n=1 Tax=Ktedonobacter sp. SOSP1-52 TaxID=2778366 RepID=UPI001915502D|nr:sugar-binding domain-containing protein [Ktedonobacter sp. SOSP1-52]GHO67705.1 hypothetical protein KSC_065970 [Ktedonobacter sp. SOSP1-52]